MSDRRTKPPEMRPKRVNFWVIAAFAGVLLLLGLIAMRLINLDSKPVRLGEQPKPFTLTTFDGEMIHSADLQGKVVLVNFWASWCTTCDIEAALLEEAWQRYQAEGEGRVLFLGVAYMDTDSASRAYLADHGVTFPNGPDLGGALSRIYQVNSVPESFVLDAEGVLRGIKIGPFSALAEILAMVDDAFTLQTN